VRTSRAQKRRFACLCGCAEKERIGRAVALLLKTIRPSMSIVAAPNASSQQCYSPGIVTQSQFESFVSKFDVLSVAHKRLENRISELEEDLQECQQALRAERERAHEITRLATQQLQEWTLEGLKTVLCCA
jgi:chromosome segregation ATPase